MKIVATPKRTRKDAKRQVGTSERLELNMEVEDDEDVEDPQPLRKRSRSLVFSRNTDAEALKQAHEAVCVDKPPATSTASPSASHVPFGRTISPSPSPPESPVLQPFVGSPIIPAVSVPASHAEHCPVEAAIPSPTISVSPVVEPFISPSVASSHRSAGLKIELTDDFVFNFSDVDNDSDDSHQSVEEFVPMPISAEPLAVIEARALVRQVWQTAAMPTFGKAMDAFLDALKLLKRSASAESPEFSCFQLFLTETPKVAWSRDEAAKRLAVSSKSLADLEEAESSSNASKELLRQTGEKHKQEKERSMALEVSIAELKRQLQEQEAELASLSHLSMAKAKYEADITEWANDRKELNRRKKRAPMLEEQRKLAEEAKVKAQTTWESLIHDHSISL